MWRIWRAPNNASRWQMGLNSEFKVLIISVNKLLLGAAMKLEKSTIIFAISVRLSVRVKQLRTNWKDFHANIMLEYFSKISQESKRSHPIMLLTFWRRNYFFLILAHLYIKCE